MIDKCPICGEYMFEVFSGHRCAPSWQIVIIADDAPPITPFAVRAEACCSREFTFAGVEAAIEKAVAYYRSGDWDCANTIAGAMLWESWLVWEDEHTDEDDDALLDPALLTWYDVKTSMEPVFSVRKLRDGGGE